MGRLVRSQLVSLSVPLLAIDSHGLVQGNYVGL